MMGWLNRNKISLVVITVYAALASVVLACLCGVALMAVVFFVELMAFGLISIAVQDWADR